MAAVPAVSFDLEIGQLVRSGLIAEVDIDYDKLDETLTELGEPDEPSHPLHIMFTACGRKEDSSGHAYAEATRRVIRMPLMQVEVDRKLSTPSGGPSEADRYTYTIDAPDSNTTLLHELRHAVDYNDPHLLQNAVDEKKRAQNVARAARWYNYVALASVTAVTGAEAINATGQIERVTMIGCMGGLNHPTLQTPLQSSRPEACCNCS